MKHLIFAASLFVFTSCHRNTDTSSIPEDPASTCKFKTITNNLLSGSRVYNVFYTGDNITELSSSVDKTKYTYNPTGQLITKETFNTGNTQVLLKTEFIYDAGGLLTEKKESDFLGDSLYPTSKYTFQYSNGKRSQMSHYDYGWTRYLGKTTYTWDGENISNISYYDDTNTLVSTTTFTYDLTKENSFFTKFNTFYLQNLYDEYFTHIYFLSKNQLTSASSYYLDPGTNKWTSTQPDIWTYTYNSKNFTKTVSISHSGSAPIIRWAFTYTCN